MALAGTAASVGRTAPAAPVTSAAQAGSGLKFFDSAICSIVGAGTVTDAAKRLITRESGSLFGPLLADVVVATVTTHCTQLVDRATSVVRSLYRLVTPYRPTRRQYVNSLALQREAAIARQITINGSAPSASYIAGSVNALCGEIAAGRSPIPVFERWYPGAKLNVLGAMNGVASLVIRQCNLDDTRAGFLVQAILGHLIDNQYRSDRDPPLVWLGTPTSQRSGNQARVSAHYSSYDFSSGAARCFIDIWYGNAWHVSNGSDTLYTGTQFAYAVRCQDRAGNVSAWSVTPYYSA